MKIFISNTYLSTVFSSLQNCGLPVVRCNDKNEWFLKGSEEGVQAKKYVSILLLGVNSHTRPKC